MNRLLVLMTAVLVSLAFSATKIVADEQSTSIVTIDGESYYVHTVGKGETIYSLARLYSVNEREITDNNPQTIEGLQEGQVLKIPMVKKEEKLSRRKERRLFDTHTVNQGETLYSISRRYEISVNTLIEDNEGLDPAHLSIGQSIKIRKKSMGDVSPEEIAVQMEDYRDAINRVATDVTYHLVEPGETLYGLSKKYGVTEEQIKSSNNLKDGLKSGAMIVIPVESIVGDDGDLILPKDAVKTDDDKGALWPWDRDVDERITIKDLSSKSVLNVSLLLPLSRDGGQGNDNFLDFYQGVLLGLEDLKADDISVKLNLYNTSRSKDEIKSIVKAPEFMESDLIIGPIYEDGLIPVLDFAESKGVAVVSPLAILEKTSSPVLFQMAPDNTNKFDKLNALVATNDNVIYISTDHPDAELENQVKPFLSAGYKELKFSQSAMSSFENLIDRKGDNIIIVSCTHEYTVDRILATISSIHNNLVARSMSKADIRVVGSSRWARFHTNIDKNLYFKLKLTYVTSYHADRGDFQVKRFDQRFIAAFNSLPSPYAYRGYDVTKLFIGAAKSAGSDFVRKLNSNRLNLLQMSYNFVNRSGLGKAKDVEISEKPIVKEENYRSRPWMTDDRADAAEREKKLAERKALGFVNNEWALVCYNSNYTIEVR